jgi:hypothetical protein
MPKRVLKEDEFRAFFDDVANMVTGTRGAQKNLLDVFKKYDLEVPQLPPPYGEEFGKLLTTDFKEARKAKKPKYHCEICSVCALCILCGELNAGVGAGSVSGILGLFNDARMVPPHGQE